MTPLEAVTEKILAAISGKDFVELAQAIKERKTLLASGAEVTLRAWELGDQAAKALLSLKQSLALESLRLDQIRKIAETFPERSSSHREYFG
jgi:hypothetical protein